MAVVVVDWPDAQRGVFAISVAAELCGLHPQTLRVYEREGLVDPDRSSGGTRLYSGQDLEKLREISALTDLGINIAGIKRVLELQEELRRLQAQVEQMGSKVKNRDQQL
ncbi:MAG TPA: helix-turn-helix transcriptional regulator [Solirubrobacterales bacterium]|nr:helix-turn-helix transcriptional regulator [Solirubrobacterales bacterium]